MSSKDLNIRFDIDNQFWRMFIGGLGRTARRADDQPVRLSR
jgi:hypothetical protein